MTLLTKTYQHLAWQAHLSREVLSRTGSQTILGTAALVLSQYAQLFALFLPLKVLILLNGDRVPHALETIITPDTKITWIIGLSVAIFIVYLLSIALVTLANRQYTQACNLLQSGRDLSRGTRRRLHKCYFKLWRANSEALVAIIGFVVLGFLSPLLLSTLLLFLAMELITASYFAERTSGLGGQIGSKLRKDYPAVLQYGAALNFLLVFAVLLLEFFLSGEIDLVSAVLIIFVTRRCLQSLTRFTREGVLLATQYRDAEALLFGVGVLSSRHVDVQDEITAEM